MGFLSPGKKLKFNPRSSLYSFQRQLNLLQREICSIKFPGDENPIVKKSVSAAYFLKHEGCVDDTW